MRMRLTHVGLVGVLLLLCAGTASAEVMTWKVEGDTREAIVFAPKAFPAGGRAPSSSVSSSVDGETAGTDSGNASFTVSSMNNLCGSK